MTQPPLTNDWIGTMNLARSFLRDAEILKRSVQEGQKVLSAPNYFLYYHSAELSLKSLLLSHGKSNDEVKDIGHSLDKLTDAAIKLGITLSRSTTDYFDMIKDCEGHIRIRYHNTGWTKRISKAVISNAAQTSFKELSGLAATQANSKLPFNYFDPFTN